MDENAFWQVLRQNYHVNYNLYFWQVLRQNYHVNYNLYFCQVLRQNYHVNYNLYFPMKIKGITGINIFIHAQRIPLELAFLINLIQVKIQSPSLKN